MALSSVFVLHHVHVIDDDDENVKLLGVYSTRAIAMDRIETYKNLPGFKECPDGFEITEYEIDEDNWQEGYITVLPGEEL